MLNRAIFLSLIGALAALNLPAQDARATIGGRVNDLQGAAVPNAVIEVIAEDTAVRQTTITNEQGNWTVQFLLPGRYRFSVSRPGFKTMIRDGLTLQAADIKQFDVVLEVGAITQSVEVTAEAALIDTTSATSGTVISSREMTEMPTLSHVPTLLAVLSPGVVAQDQNNNIVRPWSYIGASQFTADGGRNNIYSNNFVLDGMPNTKAGGYVAFIPPMDSMQEFRVQTNAYDASIGRQAGATLNMQTKSGTKDYHLVLYWFNQNNILNAKLFQTNLVNGVKPPVHFNEPGGTFGGPVWIPKVYNGRKKTFFFFSYDRTHTIDPRTGSTRSVPTALERGGDFTQSFTTQSGQRFPIQVYDPLTVAANGNRTLFPGSMIPAPRQSAIAQNILKYVPLPNTAGDPTSNASNNFVAGSVANNTIPMVSVRVDQAWNNAHHSFVTVRWSHLVQDYDNYFQSKATGFVQERVSKSAGMDHVWTLSSNKVLDLRYSVNRYEQPGFDNGAGFDPTQLGFSSGLASQLIKPSFPRITGFGGDFGSGQGGTYQSNTYHTWSAALSHSKGNHNLRYGAEYWTLQEADGGIGVQPQFDFNSNWTRQNATTAGGTGVGSTFGSYLLGLPSGGNAPVNANGMYSQHFAGFYFQDDWRVTQKLTLNLGMRWDVQVPVTERYNRLTSQFDLSQTNPISNSAQAAYAAILANAGNAGNTGVQTLKQILPANSFRVPGAVLFAGVNGQPRGYSNTDYHEWQPRAGFAYRLSPNTVVRGGVGRFTQASYDRGGQNGFSRTTSLIATQDNFFTPFDTLANPFRGGILSPTGSSLGPLTNLGAGVDFNDPNPDRFYSWEYSLHLQHQLKSWLIEVGYSHNKTYNIGQSRQQGNPATALWQQLNGPQFDGTGRPLDTLLWNALVPNPFYQLPGVNSGSIGSSQTVVLRQLLYSDPLLGQLSKNNMPLGTNRYDALLVKVEHRFSKGFSIINSFTYSKLFEDTSLLGPEIAGIHVEHKLGGEDRPLHLSVAPIWEIPVGRGQRFGSSMPKIANAVAGGWELTGQFTLQSGVPVVFGTDSFFTGKDFSLPRDKQSLNQWFETSQFLPFPSKNTNIATYPSWTGVQALPGYGWVPPAGDSARNGVYQDFGTYVRNYPTRWGDVRASRVNEFNLGLFKNFKPKERMKLQFRFEAFNALNHPRFAAPETNPGSSNFGRVQPSQQNNARAIQMGAKLMF
jgi:hypothetical protein